MLESNGQALSRPHTWACYHHRGSYRLFLLLPFHHCMPLPQPSFPSLIHLSSHASPVPFMSTFMPRCGELSRSRLRVICTYDASQTARKNSGIVSTSAAAPYPVRWLGNPFFNLTTYIHLTTHYRAFSFDHSYMRPSIHPSTHSNTPLKSNIQRLHFGPESLVDQP